MYDTKELEDFNASMSGGGLRTASCMVKPRLNQGLEIVPVEDFKEVEEKAELYIAAKKIGVSVERLLQMREYAAKLKKQFPHMKENRIQRKVAEYFKIKLT